MGKAGFCALATSRSSCLHPWEELPQVSPTTKLSEICRTLFSRCLFWKVNHMFCWEAQNAAASFFQNSHLSSVTAAAFCSHVPLPFPSTPHSWTEAHLPDGDEWPQGRRSALHPQCWRGMQRNNFVLPQISSSLWFFSCFAGLPALTGVVTDNSPENFFIIIQFFSLFLKFLPSKSLCLLHHCLTSYCQSSLPARGVMYSLFHFNHSLWGLEGNLEVTRPSSHQGRVFSSWDRQPGSSLFCSAARPLSGTHPSSGIFLIFSCPLFPGDI